MSPAASTSNRTYAAAHFALELDGGDSVGLFRSIEGGGVRTDVMTYQQGGVYDRWRQLGKPKFEDIKLQVGMAMSEPFYDWISAFFAGEAVRKNGAIVAADFYYAERARREFKEALIKELTFPKLDGQDKSAAYMTIGLAVETIEFKKGDSSKKLQQPNGFDSQKLWTSSNFRFRVDGFDTACRRVSKLDSFTVKQNVLEYHSGGARSPTKTPSSIDFPNLSFYIPEADADTLIDEFDKRGIQGQQPGPLHGELVCLDNGGRTLFTLHYFGAEICGVTPDKSDATSEEIKQVKIEMSTERMSFEYAGGLG